MNKILLRTKNAPILSKRAIVTSMAQEINGYFKNVFKNSLRVYSSITTKPPTFIPTAHSSTGPSIPIPGESYELHLLNEPPKNSSEMSKEEALKCYRDMHRIRKMENAVSSMYLERKIRGFCHLYIGQEACAVGLKTVMGPDDSVITTYRCHGWALVMGESMEAIIGEMLGKKNGSARGKGGSMHIYGKNFYGGNGIVGAHIPVGTGIALANKYKNNGAISWTIFGDGAADQGQTYESYNMAKLWNLPVIYVIENNHYSMGTATLRHSASTKYFTRGDPIPGMKVDGMDLLAVREAARYAVNHIKSGKGPIILQLDTYRYKGHSMSDPGTSYRKTAEIQQVKEMKDSIRHFTEKLTESQLITSAELKTIEDEVKVELRVAIDKSLKETEPPLDEFVHDIYKDYQFSVRVPQMANYRNHKNSSHLNKKEQTVRKAKQ